MFLETSARERTAPEGRATFSKLEKIIPGRMLEGARGFPKSTPVFVQVSSVVHLNCTKYANWKSGTLFGTCLHKWVQVNCVVHSKHLRQVSEMRASKTIRKGISCPIWNKRYWNGRMLIYPQIGSKEISCLVDTQIEFRNDKDPYFLCLRSRENHATVEIILVRQKKIKPQPAG